MTKQLTTVATKAKQIRKALKSELGASRKQVSVRSSNYSMGSSIKVEIKTLDITRPAVKAIAEQAESVRRCSHSGEILSGGNRFVFVDYADEALEPVRAMLQAEVEAAMADETIHQVFGVFNVTRTQTRGSVEMALWLDGRNVGSAYIRDNPSWDATSIARQAAYALADSGTLTGAA